MTGQGRDQCGGHREVSRRLGDAQTAGDVEIDIAGAKDKAAARLEHREDHREPAAVPPHHRASRRAEARGRDQGLDLDQHRTGPFHAGKDRGAADLAMPVGEK